MKYHLKNKISRREIRKIGKNIIPIDLMKCAQGAREVIEEHKDDMFNQTPFLDLIKCNLKTVDSPKKNIKK